MLDKIVLTSRKWLGDALAQVLDANQPTRNQEIILNLCSFLRALLWIIRVLVFVYLVSNL